MGLQPGERILDRYVVERLLGRGGMGEVHVGNHDRLGLPVAIKVLTDTNAEMEKRFAREAALMARVRHPNIVGILDSGTSPAGFPCIIMEFIEGEELRALVKRTGPLPWPVTVELMSHVVAGLAAMHGAGVLHRDLKPANIVVAVGPPVQARIIDFGIARPTEGDGMTKLTATGAMIGTPAYMAPEQLLGAPLDARSDLYACGLIWCDLLAGKTAAGGMALTSMLRRLQESPPIPEPPPGLPALPAPLRSLLTSLLRADPAERPQTAAALHAAMVALLAHARPGSPRLADLDVRPGSPEPDPAEASPMTATRAVQRPQSGATAAGYVTPNPFATPSPQTAALHEAPTQALAPAQAGVRYLLAARLPPSRLANPDERRWLLGLLGQHGRGFVLGGQFWFAVQKSAAPVATSGQFARTLLQTLRERYGQHVVTRARFVEAEFALTPAQLAGAEPLPEPLAALLDDIAAADGSP